MLQRNITNVRVGYNRPMQSTGSMYFIMGGGGGGAKRGALHYNI